jgi:hypothetical protein
MEIKIEQPIALHLEVFETDDHVPSMHMNVQIVVSQFQHTCRYDGTFWIECASWDAFTDSLRALLWQEAVLRDISANFMLTLRRTDETVLFVWEFTKKDVGGNRWMNVMFSSEIDDDMLGKIKREFLDFPVWW